MHGPEVRQRLFAREIAGEFAVERAVGLGDDPQIRLGSERLSELPSLDLHIQFEDIPIRLR
jgi:hypothetical protein